jgi:hypothetical protein
MVEIKGHMLRKDTICFDIETELFSDDFRHAKSDADRIRFAPKMRLACAYFEKEATHRFYEVHEAEELIRALSSAREVITYNGKGFDLLVLKKHYGLRDPIPLKGEHVDLFEVIYKGCGQRVSLDNAVYQNLGQRKHTAGRSMAELNIAELSIACKSDVDQTYLLWKKYNEGTLAVPEKKQFSKISRDHESMEAGAFMPSICSNCLDVACLEFIESDSEEMTDGQFAEYIAGTQGLAGCRSCGKIVFWEM